MLSMRKFNLALLSMLTLGGHFSAMAERDYTTSDVIGMFAGLNQRGPYAEMYTVSEAHMRCLSNAPTSDSKATGYEKDAHAAYKTCMAQYVPFKVTGAGAAGSCGATVTRWGECAASLPAMPNGSFFSAKNTESTELYEGYANLQCSNGNWVNLGGGCSRAVSSCEAGEIVEWPVTSPLWADESSATVYLDKFGQVRHSPKARCKAKMPEALSGKLLITKATVPETPSALYNVANSSVPLRCFNKEWLNEAGSGLTNCDYVPKSCAATTYTHPSGCSYSLPSGAHDTIFNSSSPSPQNSQGSLQAYCWDGQWEIKAASCAASCATVVPAKTWASTNGGVTRQCQHSSKTYSQRIAPGATLLINNEVAGLGGTVSYSCVNGDLATTSTVCGPSDCGSLPGSSWTVGGQTCSHSSVPGNFVHGQTITQRVGGLFSDKTGEVSYKCEYGVFTRQSGATCGLSSSGGVICDGSGSGVCPAGSVTVADGICCAANSDGTVSCATTDTGTTTPSTPTSSFTFACKVLSGNASGGSTSSCLAADIQYISTSSSSTAKLELKPSFDGKTPANWSSVCPGCTWKVKANSYDSDCLVSNGAGGVGVNDGDLTEMQAQHELTTEGVAFWYSAVGSVRRGSSSGSCTVGVVFSVTDSKGVASEVTATGRLRAEHTL